MNAGDDPLTASQIWTSPRYNDAVLKCTSPISSKLLFDAGYSFNYEEYVITNQDGINQDRGTPAWYAGASRRDADAGDAAQRPGATGAAAIPIGSTRRRRCRTSPARTTSRSGFQYNWGTYINTRETNADLQQVYLNGVPSPVTVYNTPLRYKDALLGDLGLYAQDTWTLNRLTLNGGIRWETLKSRSVEAGVGRRPLHRRAQLRPDPDADVEGLGAAVRRWSTTCSATPRRRSSSASTATTSRARRSSPIATTRWRCTSASLSWTDANGDDIAQGELGCTYLTAGLRDQLRAAAGQLRPRAAEPRRSRLQARLQHRNDGRHPARAAAAACR